jgi:lipopolysaccharide/colanic/teichoic acid biosynthesis glycosyltransferase
MIYQKHIKGWLDRLLALWLAVTLLPVFLCICILLLVSQGRPLFFIQARSGKNMSMFRLVKFRTMLPSENKELSIKDKKFTFFGRFMRNTGIDEIPQIYNIMKGDMSFVGPRPLPVEYDKLYSDEHKKRFSVKPGITGLAQVNGKNDITWGRRFDLDIRYIREVSLRLDFKIILLTIRQLFEALFKKKSGNIEMPVFDGSNLK